MKPRIQTAPAIIAIILVIAGLHFLKIRSALALDSDSLIQHRQDIENQVREIVTAFDKDANVIVSLEFQTESLKLPSTSFTLNKITLDQNQLPKIKSASVVIFTNNKSLPDDVKLMIDKTLGNLGDKLNMDVRIREKEANFNAFTQGALSQPSQLLIAGGVIGFIIIFALFGAIFILYSQSKFKSMMNNMKLIADAVRESGSESQVINLDKDEEIKQIGSSQRLLGAGDDKIFSALNERGLLALLTDCYWSEQDSYAAFIWKRIPIEKRASLIEKIEFLGDYVAMLANVDEASLGKEQEPYYLNPLPIELLNNEALSDFVRKQPELLKALPSLRADYLNLDFMEKLNLMQSTKDKSKSKGTFNLSNVKPSTPRKAKQRAKFEIHDVTKEMELLDRTDIDLDILHEIPTLAWITKLPDEVVAERLQSMSAQDIVSLWIGPTEVLEKLGKNISEKKLKLVESYKQKIKPSRDSRGFRSLQRFALDQLRKEADEENLSVGEQDETAA